MRLSDNFSLEEFSRTDVREYQISNALAAQQFVGPLRVTAQLLEQVRVILGGAPLFVDSGYRSKELNAAIGGSATSQHCAGQAVDFRGAGWQDTDFRDAIRSLIGSHIRFHQLLLEHGCLHISTPYEMDAVGEVAIWSHVLVDGVWTQSKTVLQARISA